MLAATKQPNRQKNTNQLEATLSPTTPRMITYTRDDAAKKTTKKYFTKNKQGVCDRKVVPRGDRA